MTYIFDAEDDYEYEDGVEESSDFADEELSRSDYEAELASGGTVTISPPSGSTTGSYVTYGGGGGGGIGTSATSWVSSGSTTYASLYSKAPSIRDKIMTVLESVGVTESELLEASYIPPLLSVKYMTPAGTTATITVDADSI